MRRFHFDGWSLSDIRIDYLRMDLLHNPLWQLYDNSSGEISETYPPYLLLPSTLSPEMIRLAASYRSKNRLPVVTYCDMVSSCVLVRSSQPLVGITLQTSTADQLLLGGYRTCAIKKM